MEIAIMQSIYGLCSKQKNFSSYYLLFGCIAIFYVQGDSLSTVLLATLPAFINSFFFSRKVAHLMLRQYLWNFANGKSFIFVFNIESDILGFIIVHWKILKSKDNFLEIFFFQTFAIKLSKHNKSYMAAVWL